MHVCVTVRAQSMQFMKPDPKPENVTATVYPIMDTAAAPEPDDGENVPSSPTVTGKKRRADEMSPVAPSTPRVSAVNAFVPTRPKLTRRVVRVECRVVEVYRPGRSNLQDKIHTIQHIQPQSLVLVHGKRAR